MSRILNAVLIGLIAGGIAVILIWLVNELTDIDFVYAWATLVGLIVGLVAFLKNRQIV